MESWGFFTADGNELNRGYQAYERQARKLAQEKANRLGEPVEFIAESRLVRPADAGDDWEPPTGEVVHPQPEAEIADEAIRKVLDGVTVRDASGAEITDYGQCLIAVSHELDGSGPPDTGVEFERCSREGAASVWEEHRARVSELFDKACGGHPIDL